MPEPSQPLPSPEWLNHLHDAGHWDRLIEMSKQRLNGEPNDEESHLHLAWAYAKTDRVAEMAPHVQFLLQADPENLAYHHVAAIYFLDSYQLVKAKQHIDTLLQGDSQSATYHYLACIFALRSRQPVLARDHIRHARRLAPEWASAAHLEILMDPEKDHAVRYAWDTIRRYEEALRLDPEHTDIIASMGDVYLENLEMPDKAEECYRTCLSKRPGDKSYQRRLLNAIRKRSLLYRTLSLPALLGLHFLNRLRGGITQWFLMLIMCKAVAILLCWMALTGLLFTPAAKVYEWFIIQDPRTLSQQSWLGSRLSWGWRFPLWLRFGSVLSVFLIAWTAFFSWLLNLPVVSAGVVTVFYFAVHFAAVAAFVGIRKMLSKWGKKQSAHYHEKSQPPPLPNQMISEKAGP